MKRKEPIGAYWKETPFSPLYQLSRRVEQMAELLERRRRDGHGARVEHIQELSAIALELKDLDRPLRHRQNGPPTQ